MSKRGIAKRLGLSINTVRKYIKEKEEPNYKLRAKKPLKLDPYHNYIKKHLSGIAALGSFDSNLRRN